MYLTFRTSPYSLITVCATVDGHDSVTVILKCPPGRVSTYVHALFSHKEFLRNSSNPPSYETIMFKIVERHAQHRPDRLKSRAGLVGTDRLGQFCVENREEYILGVSVGALNEH